MPIPILIAGAALSGAYGVYKSIKGASDQKEASNINADAQNIVDEAREKLESQRQSTNKVLTDYGSRKLRAFEVVIADFIESFGRLKNVEIQQSTELDKLNLGDFSSQTLSGLTEDYQALKAAGLGVGAGLGGGAALAFGAYNGTMLLASASTGTAIASLSGAAATNATLAWLGGGSLAAGGYGMAGGMMVLGGIVAGPALAIFGHIVGNKGEEAINNARSNHEQALTVKEESNKMAAQLYAVEKVTSLANTTFSNVTTQLRRSVRDLEKIIESEGANYQIFSQESKDKVLRAAKLAQLTKAMIDTPILDAEGNLVLSTEKRVQEISTALT